MSQLTPKQIATPSCPLHSLHLPLFYLEIVRFCWTPMESLPWCLVTVLVVLVAVTEADVCATVVWRIRLVTNTQIISTSKDWPITLTHANCILRLWKSELVVDGERKYEQLFRVFCCVCTMLWTAPFQGSEAPDLLVKLGPDDCDSVNNPVTFLVNFSM